MSALFFKVTFLWVVMVILAILNGLFRENILIPLIGQDFALPISGLSLSLIIFTTIYLSFSFLNKQNDLTYFLIGLQWVVMTLLFEFLSAFYLLEKPWSEILQLFDISSGNLFSLVLLTTLLSPITVSKIKRVV